MSNVVYMALLKIRKKAEFACVFRTMSFIYDGVFFVFFLEPLGSLIRLLTDSQIIINSNYFLVTFEQVF